MTDPTGCCCAAHGAGGRVSEFLGYVLLDGAVMVPEPFSPSCPYLNGSAQAADSRVLGAGGWG